MYLAKIGPSINEVEQLSLCNWYASSFFPFQGQLRNGEWIFCLDKLLKNDRFYTCTLINKENLQKILECLWKEHAKNARIFKKVDQRGTFGIRSKQ